MGNTEDIAAGLAELRQATKALTTARGVEQRALARQATVLAKLAAIRGGRAAAADVLGVSGTEVDRRVADHVVRIARAALKAAGYTDTDYQISTAQRAARLCRALPDIADGPDEGDRPSAVASYIAERYEALGLDGMVAAIEAAGLTIREDNPAGLLAAWETITITA